MKFKVGDLTVYEKDITVGFKYNNFSYKYKTNSTFNNITQYFPRPIFLIEHYNTGIIIDSYPCEELFDDPKVTIDYNIYKWYSQLSEKIYIVFEAELVLLEDSKDRNDYRIWFNKENLK